MNFSAPMVNQWKGSSIRIRRVDIHSISTGIVWRYSDERFMWLSPHAQLLLRSSECDKCCIQVLAPIQLTQRPKILPVEMSVQKVEPLITTHWQTE